MIRTCWQSRIAIFPKLQDWMNLMVREAQKEMRRQRTLDAAEALIRKTGTIEFSMQTLASKAKLSLATPYNLFGSKSAILYALLDGFLDEIAKESERAFAHRHPFQRVLKAQRIGPRVCVCARLLSSLVQIPARRQRSGSSPGLYEPVADLTGRLPWLELNRKACCPRR